MTRSDIMLEVSRLNEMTGAEKTILIAKLHYKIEQVYKILFGLEKVKEFEPIAELLRKALESN